ncbi:type II toxin-antitoxin system VapC family toxin [Spirosoma pulveris]
MRLLIDTQIFIWFQLNDPQLPKSIRLLIEDLKNDVFVSHLSFMEVIIKQVVNRLPTFTIQTEELIEKAETDGFIILPTSLAHISAYKRIPFFDDHRDPFDRLLLATALAEQMSLISADEKFSRYQDLVDIIW